MKNWNERWGCPMTETFLSAALAESVSEVLEKMFFIRVLDPSEPIQATSDSEISAAVSFRGDPSGALTLRVTHGVARSIGADFLGESEEDLSERQIEEVIRELANMICGSVLSRVEGSTTFHLAEPSIVVPELSGVMPPGAARHVAALGGGNLTVFLETEPLLCPVKEKSAS